MTKKEVQQRVLQNGKPLDLSKFEWNDEARVFSTTEDDLVFDFSGEDCVTFKTGWCCAFNTAYGCTFDTGSDCTFNTGWGCTFDTGSGCTFKTGWSCTFDTGSGCTFKTGWSCTFKTDFGCTFDTGWSCTFKTDFGCTFDTGSDCTFKTEEECVVVRRDIYEVIEIPEGKKIKLNDWGVKGYKVLVPKKKKTILTMDEIASKFGVKVSNLKIKK